MTPGRILIVDDERFFREVLGEALSSAGHAVRVAASGEEALTLLSREPADLLLTDLVMPGMDGLSLVREALRLDPDLEAVAVTASEDLKQAEAAMQAGCADFLSKPVEAGTLLSVAERALARVQQRREHHRLLAENVQFARSQDLYRESLRVLGTLDLEKVQDLGLQALARVADAQGAALWTADDRGGLTLRGWRGLLDRAALPARLDPRESPWAAGLRDGAPFQVDVPGAAGAAGDAFWVPLVAEEEPLGMALLADRAGGRFGGDEQAAALAVADFTAVAIRNARRHQALERVGLRDRETGAYNLSYFVDYAGKEFYKARRYGRAFSLVVVCVDNPDQLRQAAGREAYRRAIRDLVAAVSRAARDADILAKVSEGEYYVLLPETDSFGALMFQRRALEEVRKEPLLRKLDEQAPLLLSIGAATFPRDGEDFDELLHWARARVEEQRASLVRRLQLGDLEPGAFWELVDLLLAGEGRLPEGTPSARLPADPERFAAAQREAAREIARDPRARGLLYVGTAGGLGRAPLLSALPPGDGGRAGDATVHVYLLGPRQGPPAAHPLVTEVFLDGDKRMAGHEFLLFLSEHSAYAWLSGPGGRAFHTSDVPLVDALVGKLQALYDLQPI